MKALSIRQPWAWAILNLGKNIENRTWSTEFRGSFLIHTGKTIDKNDWIYLAEKYPEIPNYKELITGGIVGIADLVDCVQSSESPWFYGPYGFILENVKEVGYIPFTGALGFFETGITISIKDGVTGIDINV